MKLFLTIALVFLISTFLKSVSLKMSIFKSANVDTFGIVVVVVGRVALVVEVS